MKNPLNRCYFFAFCLCSTMLFPDEAKVFVPQAQVFNPDKAQDDAAEKATQEGNYKEAIAKYKQLHEEDPSRADYIYKMALNYGYLKNWKKANYYMEAALKKDPKNQEYRTGYARILYWQGRNTAALKQLALVTANPPYNTEVDILLSEITLAQAKITKSMHHLDDARKKEPDNLDIWFPLAQNYYADHKFTQSMDALEKAKRADPTDLEIDGLINDVIPFIEPSLNLFGGYSQERESDLITKIRTTEIDNVYSSATFYAPINNWIRPFLLFEYNRDTEKNLQLGSNNYNVNNYDGGVGVDFFFRKYTSLNLACRYRKVDNVGTNVFPFQEAHNVEPSGTFLIDSPTNFLLLSGYRDSFVAQDYNQTIAYLEKRNNLLGIYQYTFVYPATAAGVQAYTGFYQNDDNRKDNAAGWLKFSFPIYAGFCVLQYRFDYNRFEKVVPNYYSFSNEQVQAGRITLLREWLPNKYIELNYNFSWHFINHLINDAAIITTIPPTPPVIIPNHEYHDNEISLVIRHSMNKHFRFELFGSYYINSDDYEAWTATGLLRFVF